MIKFSIRAYRWLLRLYPRNFHECYSNEILQVFRDSCRDAYQQEGKNGILRLWLPILGDLLLNAIAEHIVQLRRHKMALYRQNLPSILLFGSGLLVLLGSWVWLFLFVEIAVDAFLSPWQIETTRPPLGQWDRSLHDFFQSMPAAYMPSLIVVGISLWLFVRAIHQHGIQAELPWLFVASNILYSILDLAATGVAHGIMNTLLPYSIYSYDPGYHRTTLPFAFSLVMTIALLKIQHRLTFPRRRLLIVG